MPRPKAGDEVKPVTAIFSPLPETGSMPRAVSRPRSAYTADSSRPSPGVKKTSSPSRFRRTETSGLPRAQCRAADMQAEASERSDLRNFSRAGVLWKISRTVMLVPSGQPMGDISMISPA